MKLALRKQPAQDASWWQRIFASLTKFRLVSDYQHGGIVIGDLLYHITSDKGLHVSTFHPERWDLFEVPGDEMKALNTFKNMKGTQYDFIGLLAFITPWNVNSKTKMYCFEWCAHILGMGTKTRITPERLLAHLHILKQNQSG